MKIITIIKILYIIVNFLQLYQNIQIFLLRLNILEIYNVDFKYYTDLNFIHRGCKIMFDFHELPPGEYFVNFEYKRRIYNTKYKIVIIKAKSSENFEIYYDYNYNNLVE